MGQSGQLFTAIVVLGVANASCGSAGDDTGTIPTTTAPSGSGGHGGGTGGYGTGGEGGGWGGFLGPGGSGGGQACPSLTTCAKAGANCGPIADGCNGILQCGTCSFPDTCGGGGIPSVCGGGDLCVPTTCADLGATCGPIGDGCGGVVQCGDCSNGQTCGGGGVPSVCGSGSVCVPTTCAALGITCGPAGDGCGQLLDCGACTLPETCGGAGVPSVCGQWTCTPRSCADAGANCGPVADGCGALLDCGACTPPAKCGGGDEPSVCAIPSSCTGLCLQQVACPNNQTTTIRGTVYAPGRAGGPLPGQPGGPDPLFGALVYIPNAPVAAFTAGVSCDQCDADVSGAPLVSAVTGPDGRFELKDVPVGTNIPLVIQLGRWRRQTVIPTVSACQDNPISDYNLTRLPRNKGEGDIPKMALSTGKVDALECVLRKIGLDDAEFTRPSGTGRVHVYQGQGAAGARIGPGSGTPNEGVLLASQATLHQYDMILFPCQGGEYYSSRGSDAMWQDELWPRLKDYTAAGGRLFTTHYSYVWLHGKVKGNGWGPGPGPWEDVVAWNVGQDFPPDQTGNIDTSFPKGLAFAQWLINVGASSVLGQIPVSVVRHDVDAVSTAQEWMSATNPAGVPLHFTFNTPVEAQEDLRCGRVVFSDFHVDDRSVSNTTDFPAECDDDPMTPQEKLVEFMIFDLSSCITPDIPICVPRTCAELGLQCGPASDGCGNLLQCGDCPPGQTCGGGGIPGVCGAPSCKPLTCSILGIQCGPAGDGCGNLLQCGDCPPGQTCGGGGVPGVCGSQPCTPRTCAQLEIECGPAGDGCGNLLQCGDCPPGQTCGGGGTPGVCGAPSCTPRTCAQLGAECGAIGDGCGNLLQCGPCVPPKTCGGSGKANRCGGGLH